MYLSELLGVVISGVNVSDDSHAGIGCKNALDASRGLGRPVRDNYLTCVQTIADSVMLDGTTAAAIQISFRFLKIRIHQHPHIRVEDYFAGLFRRSYRKKI